MEHKPLHDFDWREKYFESRLNDFIVFMQERDRRYSEVNIEREKALKIKDEADKAALLLRRENQIYKDEKANNLRSQIESERGTYATHLEIQALNEKFQITINPVLEYISSQRGGQERRKVDWGYLVGAFSIGIAIAMYFK